MRKIDQNMLNAIKSGNNWTEGNTSVRHIGGGCHVFLHHNRIATVVGEEVTVDVQTLKVWPSLTTKNRLRALGVNVSTSKGVIMLDGVDINTL